MSFGPFLLPLGVVVILAALATALIVLRFFKNGRDVELSVYVSLVGALICARAAFVFSYFPSYKGHLARMIDFRDFGFDTTTGFMSFLILAVVTIGWSRGRRRALSAALLAGLLIWIAGTALSGTPHGLTTIPPVELTNPAGGSEDLSQFRGKVTVINLWATWCGPCREEMPELAQAQAEHNDFNIVFINQAESPVLVDEFMSQLRIHPRYSFFDQNLIFAKMTSVKGYPTTLIYDEQGKLIDMHVGRISRAMIDAAVSRARATAGDRTAFQ